MRTPAPSSQAGSLSTYLSEISRYPLLTVDEEQRLAKQVDGWTDEWLRLSETADA